MTAQEQQTIIDTLNETWQDLQTAPKEDKQILEDRYIGVMYLASILLKNSDQSKHINRHNNKHYFE